MANYIYHYGTKGQKWGVRRYQNEDGTLTAAGRERYNATSDKQGRRIGLGVAGAAAISSAGIAAQRRRRQLGSLRDRMTNWSHFTFGPQNKAGLSTKANGTMESAIANGALRKSQLAPDVKRLTPRVAEGKGIGTEISNRGLFGMRFPWGNNPVGRNRVTDAQARIFARGKQGASNISNRAVQAAMTRQMNMPIEHLSAVTSNKTASLAKIRTRNALIAAGAVTIAALAAGGIAYGVHRSRKKRAEKNEND